jgi:hypothetical protein
MGARPTKAVLSETMKLVVLRVAVNNTEVKLSALGN